MENNGKENGKDQAEARDRPGGSDVWNIFAKPIPMKWIAVFIIAFLAAYTYFRIKHL